MLPVAHAASPPNVTWAVAKPANLPARLPWASGLSYSLGGNPYNPYDVYVSTGGPDGSDHVCATGYPEDCFALDVPDPNPKPPTPTAQPVGFDVYALFPGTVTYAGCATGKWAHYGQIVYVSTSVNGVPYQAFYAHLSSLTVRAGASVGMDSKIGTAGDSVTTNGQCTSSNDYNQKYTSPPYDVNLHFAIYQNAQFCRDGQAGCRGTGPHDGKAVVPEPLVGKAPYENFEWWSGPMSAATPSTGGSSPTATWTNSAIQTAQHVAYGTSVHYAVHVGDTVAVRAVEFTVDYQNTGWNNPADLSFSQPPYPEKPFDPQQVWRWLAICTPAGGTPGCTWSGTGTSADVSFDWNPASEAGSNPSPVPWLPSALPAVTPQSTEPTPVCVGFEVVDSTGTQMLPSNGTQCSSPSSVTGGTDTATRLVYLDPPPATETVSDWGNNYYGELGNGTTTDSSTPVQVDGLSGVTQIAGGNYHTLTLRSDGTVWGWGANAYGQLGDGGYADSHVPVQAVGLSGVTEIASGYFNGIALKSDGTVWTWGYNDFGELGNGTFIDSLVPVEVSGLTGVVMIASGGDQGLALKSDGTVWSWGYNSNGQLGNGTTQNSNVPVQVTGLSDVVALAGGSQHSLAVKADGTVWAWGAGWDGELGNGQNSYSTVPVQVTGLGGVTAIAGGEYDSLALKSDGTVWAWGSNDFGQLGTGAGATNVPAQVTGLTGVSSIASGGFHSVALKSDGTVWAWGNNDYGQLGNGTTTDSPVPVEVSGLSGIEAISGGYYHSIALSR